MNTSSIAKAINDEICAALCEIPFVDWVRAALGYTLSSVERLVGSVSSMRDELTQRFTELY